MTLFRKEVAKQGSEVIGEIVLIHPPSHLAVTGFATAVLIAIILVLTCGKYTRHTTIPGIIEPNDGLVKIYANLNGVVTAVLVHDGQRVHKGDVLVTAETERRDAQGTKIQQNIDLQARSRLSALNDELANTMSLSDQEARSINENLLTLSRSHENLTAQLATQRLREASALDKLERNRRLEKAGFISEAQVKEHEGDLSDQTLRAESLKRELIQIEGDIAKFKRDLTISPYKRNVSRSQLERNIAAVRGEISQLGGERNWSVVAPCDGTITAVTIVAGQTATQNAPLISMKPKDSVLQVKLYAPSKSLGFVRTGNVVRIRLDAFPFQKFGYALGSVGSIADAPIASNEFSSATSLMPKIGSGTDPLFAIVVKLDRQSLNAYGREEVLRSGMQVDGDIQLDQRRIYEWLLEPLFAVMNR